MGRITQAQADRLLAAIKSTAAARTLQERVGAALDALQAVVPFESAAAMVLDPTRPEEPHASRCVFRGIGRDLAFLYWQEYWQHDPKRHDLRTSTGRPFLLSQFVSDREFGRDPFTADLMKPYHVRYELLFSVPVGAGQLLTVGLHRAPERGDYTRDHLRVVARLLPELGRVARGALLREELARVTPERGVERGTLLLDATGALSYADPTARALLDECADEGAPVLDELLSVAERLLATGQEGEPGRTLRPLIVGGDVEARLYLVRVGVERGVMVELTVRRPGSDGLATSIATRHRLSPREREVALLAARGLGNSEIARLLGLSGSTVKLHLANAYRKVGVHGRTELTALLVGGRPPHWNSSRPAPGA